MFGALTVLEAGDAGEEAVQWHIRSLRHGVDVMCEITDAVIDIHALSVGRMKLSEGWTSVRELLEGCAPLIFVWLGRHNGSRLAVRTRVCMRKCV